MDRQRAWALAQICIYWLFNVWCTLVVIACLRYEYPRVLPMLYALLMYAIALWSAHGAASGIRLAPAIPSERGAKAL